MTILNNPLIKVLERLESRGSSGILELNGGAGREKLYVYFYDGSIEAISTSRDEDRLGQYLLREEILDRESLDRLLKQVKKKHIALGEALVEGGVLDAAELTEVLTSRLVALLDRAANQRFQAGSFTGSTKGAKKHRLRLSNFQIALELARRRPLELKLAPSQTVELSGETELKPRAWSPEEISILTHLQSRSLSVEELEERTALGGPAVMSVLQAFLDLGMIRVVERAPIPGGETALAKRERLPLEILVPPVHNHSPTDKVEVVNQEYSIFNEQFRALKVRLQSQTDPPVQVLSVTSPLPQDGKSLISTNLALNFAKEPGRRVLLVDADLRGPTVHEKLGIGFGPGLHQYLLEGLEPHCYIRRVGNLYVMTAGEYAENAVELLSLGRMKEFLRFARDQFDTVIFDAPPLIPIADTQIISQLTDATVLVVYRGKTPFRMIKRSLEVLDKRKLLGVVLNGVQTTGFNGYYSYYYNYPYHSGPKSKDGVIELKARPRATRHHRRSGNVLFR
jgi:capsular exopolysaccharide synthesis family protein